MKKIIVIGGGAAGMIAAGKAAQDGKILNEKREIILIEKNDRLGKKLSITGKGRCNLTNAGGIDFLLDNVFTSGSKYFLYPALYNFGIENVMDFFERLSVPLKIERGGRVFPKSDRAQDIIEALEKYMKTNGVQIKLKTSAREIVAKNKKIVGIRTDNDFIECEKVILATGGKSYPITGSSGDGYIFAKKLGHKVTKTFPSLVPLITKEHYDLQGLSLKNVSVKLVRKNNLLYKDFGEMMFTHFGLTGPVILSASRFLDNNFSDTRIIIDLKPALSEKQLDLRLQRDFEKYHNCDLKNSLFDLLPQKLIPVIVGLSNIDDRKKINQITKSERRSLLTLIKNFEMTIIGSLGFENAIVTSGGVSTEDIDSSTMQSKIIDGLYFAGEVMDIDALTGGFNLQIAFSTGYLAAQSIC